MAVKSFLKVSYDSTLDEVRDMSDVISYISPTTVPLLAMINGGSEDSPDLAKPAVQSRKAEWQEKTLRPASSLLTAALSDTTGTTVNVTATDGLHFTLGTMFRVDTEDFIVTTKGTAAGVVIAARGQGSSVAATHASGATVTITGRAHEEGTAAPTDSYTTPTQPYNYVQEFVEQISASFIEQGIKRYGNLVELLGGGRKDITNVIKMLEMEAQIKNLINLELQVIHGKRVEGSAGVPARFGGLLTFMDSDNVKDLSGASLQDKDVNDLMEIVFNKVGNGGKMPDVVVTNGRTKRILTKLFGRPVTPNAVEDARLAGLSVEYIEHDFGRLAIAANARYPARMDFLCLDDIEVLPLEDNQFRSIPLGITGTFNAWELPGTYTLKMKQSVCHASIGNYDINMPV